MGKIIKTAGGIKVRRFLLKFKNSAHIKKEKIKWRLQKQLHLVKF